MKQRTIRLVLPSIFLVFIHVTLTTGQETFISTQSANKSGGSAIFLLNDSKTVWRPLYSRQEYYFYESQIKVSPNGEYIALLGLFKIILASGERYYERMDLIVLDRSGRELTKVDSVWRYCWSPNSDQVAMLKGIRFEGKELPNTNRLQVVRIPSQGVIDLGPSDDIELTWPSFDGQIYTKARTGRVFRYSVTNKRRSLTEYKGLFFSPDGAYYFDRGLGGSVTNIFERKTGDVVDIEILNIEDANFADWVPSQPHLLVIGKVGSDKAIVEISTRSVKGKIIGEWLGFSRREQSFLIKRNGQIDRIKIER
jgi:hypothetical protein